MRGPTEWSNKSTLPCVWQTHARRRHMQQTRAPERNRPAKWAHRALCADMAILSMPDELAPPSAFAGRGQRSHDYAAYTCAARERKSSARSTRVDATVSPVHIARARITSDDCTPFPRVSLGRISPCSTHESVPRMQARRGHLENSDSKAPTVAAHQKSLASAPCRAPAACTHDHLSCARNEVVFVSERRIICLAVAVTGARRAEFEAKNTLCPRRAP